VKRAMRNGRGPSKRPAHDRAPLRIPSLSLLRHDALGALEIAARTHAQAEAQHLRLVRERAAPPPSPPFNPFLVAGPCTAMLERALESALQATGASRGNIQLFDSAAGCLRLVVQSGFADRFLDFFAEVRPHHAACGAAWSAARPVLVEDVTDSPLFDAPALEVMLDARARTVISCPLPGRGEGILGVLSVHNESPRTFSDTTRDHLDRVARRLSDRLQRVLLRRNTQYKP